MLGDQIYILYLHRMVLQKKCIIMELDINIINSARIPIFSTVITDHIISINIGFLHITLTTVTLLRSEEYKISRETTQKMAMSSSLKKLINNNSVVYNICNKLMVFQRDFSNFIQYILLSSKSNICTQ